jgi:pSer/pThr/pTyr-binding forkhead associated (FHA) protein
VSHRHASIRQRGGEHVLLDENSTNGTFMDRVRLPPQTPRALRSGERVRLGRVWLEIRFEPAMVKGSTAAAAKELALSLVSRGMRAQGEEPGPRLAVLEGPGTGATLVLADPARSYVIGRAPEADLRLDHEEPSRRHAQVRRKGDALLVQDLGSNGGTFLDGEQLARETPWKVGQVLEIGRAPQKIGFDYPAAEALAEIERSPDERMPEGEVPEPSFTPTPPAAATAPAPEATPTPAPASARAQVEGAPAAKNQPGGWSAVDSIVALVALGVLAAALVAFWLLGR